ncbi:S-layer homology domain-containing protein [Selenomonas noxia]|uniref:S-layer homology domain-containing protein n=1 Tax=Selenomonas noxia TaxID=135083 RepID=UPI0023F2D6D7|nr:S-layer homology domain-containing protein [Selenomonas noxia]
MKKTLVSALAATFVIGAAGTTFAAANPFSDVPRDHWAYDAVTQLASDGVIEGYGDGTFRGDRNITRYEMAQMVAKAMAKGNMSASDRALVDRLAAEFADELNNLGVRVSNLERNADMVKWNGKLEYTYTSERADFSRNADGRTKKNDNNLLFRLEPSAEVNSHWHVNARLDAETKMKSDAGNDGSDKVSLKRAWAQGDYDNFQVKLGKMELLSAEAYAKPGALIFDREFSGAEVSFGKDLRVKLQAGRMTSDELPNDPANYQGVELMYNGRLTAGAAYYRMNSSDLASILKNHKHTMNVWAVNAGYSFDKNNFLSAAYARNNNLNLGNKLNKSYQVSYDYKGAKPEDKGSWGAYVSYRYIGGASIEPTTDGAMKGSKGIEIGTDYTLFPNVVLSAKYFNGKDLNPLNTTNDDKVSKLFGRVEFFF